MFLYDISKLDIRIPPPPPSGLWKVMARVTVGCSDLFDSIYCFAWSKIYLKFFVQAFFYWLFTCKYHIYWTRVHWSWNLSLGVIANCQWAVSKPDTWISLPAGLWKVMLRVPVFVISPVVLNKLIGFKEVTQVLQFYSCVGKFLPEGHQGPLV